MALAPAPKYPLFISLEAKHCLVVGLGAVGERKLTTLLASRPASVLALDTRAAEDLAPTMRDLLDAPSVTFCQRPFAPQDIEGKFLVLATTSDAATNSAIATLCREKNVLCNSATAPTEGDVFLPALARGKHLALALSTSGASPALARRWRRELEEWLGPRERTVALMARLRPLVLALPGPAEEHARILQSIAAAPVGQWLADSDLASCREKLAKLLPPVLHDNLTELLHDLA